jgi:adenylate cyclase
MKKQLAAILYADAAGYSRLTGQNEELTHQQLNTGLNLLTEQITTNGGSKVHEAGDAILAEFSSVTAAVDTAVEFQKLMATRESELDKSEQIQFRIGLNVGEVIHDRDDIYGDGVNIAARIQEVAAPGNLCVSSAVLEQLTSDTSYNFDDLGYRDFKNIKRPIHVYQLRLSDLIDTYPILDLESRVQGQPLFDDAIEKPLVTKGRCSCGSVSFEISQETLGTGFCNCRICQRCTGAPVFAWAAFPIEAVKFTRDKPRYYRLSLIAEKGFCEKCGSHVIWQSLKPEPANYVAIATASLDNPEDYAPTWHGGVESQMPWLQIHDDLPRTRCEESPLLKKAWGSMGATDPDKWIDLEYESAKKLDDDPTSS